MSIGRYEKTVNNHGNSGKRDKDLNEGYSYGCVSM